MSRLNQSRRLCFGYVQNNTINNNPALIQNLNPDEITSQSGEGFAETLRSVYEKGKSALNKATDLYTSETGTKLRNLIPASDENARPGFAGEKHAILGLPNGKMGIANYLGPGTHVIERIKRGDPGRTFTDKVAKRHDIDYAIASTEPTKEKQITAIRKADERMIHTLEKNKSKDSSNNINLGLQLIKAKKLGENLGLLNKGSFSGNLSSMSDADKVIMSNARNISNQEGFGRRNLGGSLSLPGTSGGGLNLPGGSMTEEVLLPGENLKNKLIKQMTRINDFDSKKLNLHSFLKKHFDLLLEQLKIKLPGTILNKVIKSNKIDNLLPLMVMKGAGLKLAGQGVSLSDITKHIPKLVKLFSVLVKGLLKNKGMSGGSMSGKGFWADFAKGFKSVFKPGSKILGKIASALGMPEIGIPLTIISDEM